MNKIPTLSTTTHYFVDILPKIGDQRCLAFLIQQKATYKSTLREDLDINLHL